MSVTDIIVGSVALAALIVAISAHVQVDRARPEEVHDEWTPFRKLIWSIEESNGEWTFKIVDRTESFWSGPSIDVQLFGSCESRAKAERAIRRWFWQRHKESVLPEIGGGKWTGEVQP